MLRLPAHKSPKLSDASVGRTAGSLLIAPRDVTRHLHRRLMPVNRQQCQAVARPSSSGSGGNSGGCSSAAGLSWCNLTTTLRGRIAARAGFGFGKAKSSPGGKKQPGGGDTGGAKDCPCGSGALYTDCCARLHRSAGLAARSPEQLIRARYSAFVKREPRFLKDTSHPNNPALKGSGAASGGAGGGRSCTYEEDLAVTFLAVEFLGLQILGGGSSSSSNNTTANSSTTASSSAVASGSNNTSTSSSSSAVASDSSSAAASVTPGSVTGLSTMSADTATVDYEVTIKRRVDNKGVRVRQQEQQSEVIRERATVVRDEDGRWLLLDVAALQG